MAGELHEYTVEINGVETTVMLTAEMAEHRGLTKPAAKKPAPAKKAAPAAKKASTPRNKARGAANKADA